MTVTTKQWDEMMAVRHELLSTLGRCLEDASERKGLNIGRYLRAVTLEVNAFAGAYGQPALTIEEVSVIERRALGHSDYRNKFALYLAETIVYGDEP